MPSTPRKNSRIENLKKEYDCNNLCSLSVIESGEAESIFGNFTDYKVQRLCCRLLFFPCWVCFDSLQKLSERICRSSGRSRSWNATEFYCAIGSVATSSNLPKLHWLRTVRRWKFIWCSSSFLPVPLLPSEVIRPTLTIKDCTRSPTWMQY